SDGTAAHTFTATSGHTAVDVSSWNIPNLTITAPNDKNFMLVVTATQQDAGGVSAPGTGFESVTVNPLEPTIAPVAGPGGGLGVPIALNLDTGIVVNSETVAPNPDSPLN